MSLTIEGGWCMPYDGHGNEISRKGDILQIDKGILTEGIWKTFAFEVKKDVAGGILRFSFDTLGMGDNYFWVANEKVTIEADTGYESMGMQLRCNLEEGGEIRFISKPGTDRYEEEKTGKPAHVMIVRGI